MTTNRSRIQPYRWQQAAPEEMHHRLQALRRLLGGRLIVDTVADELRRVLDLAKGDLDVRWHQELAPISSGAESNSVILSAEDESGAVRAWLDVNRELSARVIVSAAKARGENLSRAGVTRWPDAALQGRLATVLEAAAKVAPGWSLKVRGRSLMTDPGAFAQLSTNATFLSFRVAFGVHAFLVRVALLREPDPPWNAERLAALGEIELRLPVVACASLATARQIASLTVDSIWFPHEFQLERRGLAFTGPVVLSGPRSDGGVRGTLNEDNTIIVSNSREDFSMSSELIDEAGDVPVVVRVEIGMVEMLAKDWANVRTGDAVRLGRSVNAPAVLRIGSREIARGDLVEIEGEIGVRITEKIEQP